MLLIFFRRIDLVLIASGKIAERITKVRPKRLFKLFK